jgi:hypothetical protein
MRRLSAELQAVVIGALYLSISLLGRFAGQDFIYFQF